MKNSVTNYKYFSPFLLVFQFFFFLLLICSKRTCKMAEGSFQNLEVLKLEVNSFVPLSLFLREFSLSAHIKHCRANKIPEKKKKKKRSELLELWDLLSGRFWSWFWNSNCEVLRWTVLFHKLRKRIIGIESHLWRSLLLPKGAALDQVTHLAKFWMLPRMEIP